MLSVARADVTPPEYLGTGTPTSSTILAGNSVWTGFGGDISGAPSLVSVIGLQGNTVRSGTPEGGDYWGWNGILSRWDFYRPSYTPTATVAASTNQTLSGKPTIDGIGTSGGSIILCFGQTNPIENGLWQQNGTGAWTRPYYWYTGTAYSDGMLCFVKSGTTYGNQFFKMTGDTTVDTLSETWASIGGGGGGGTVTNFSAGNLSPLFTTSVATSTTTPALSFTLSSAAANSWYGNATGSSAAPSFNTSALPASLIPSPSASTLGGVESYASVSHQWINSISTSGVPSSTQPAFSDISGTATTGQLPTSVNDALYRAVAFQFGNGGAVLSTGVVNATAIMPCSGTLTAVYLISADGTSGSATVDIWRANAGVPTSSTSSIVGGSGTKPSISSTTYGKDTTFTSWTSTTFSTDDVVTINLSSVTSIKYLTVELVIQTS